MMQYFIVTLRNFITLQIQTCSNFKLVYLLHHVQNFIIEQTYSDFFINCTHMRKFQEILSNLVTYPLYLQCVPKKIVKWFFDHNSQNKRARIKSKANFEKYRKFCIRRTHKFCILVIQDLRKLSEKLVGQISKILDNGNFSKFFWVDNILILDTLYNSYLFSTCQMILRT